MLRGQTNLVGEYTYVCKSDDALDLDAPDFDARWEQYLEGVADAPLKAGGTPTVFHLRHLKAGEVSRILREDDVALGLARASLVGVTGAPLGDYRFALVGKDKKSANVDDAPAWALRYFYELGGRVLERLNPSAK
jgi:hypothetical protein